MGHVYRANDPRLGREVAIKVLPEHLSDSRSALQRFETEARSVAALSHPNIVSLFDIGTAPDDAPYVVTELLRGETIRERLLRGEVPWKKAISIAAEMADGLGAAHARGIIHRDLKPDNVFLTDDGRVKILDFGLARNVTPLREDQEGVPTAEIAQKTEPGTLVGTVGYVSPEQIRGFPATQASDIFAVGCVLYEMLTGRRAFARDTAAETMTAILKDEPQELADGPQQIPFELARIVERCMAKNPAERFQSASDLAFALRALSASGSMEFARPRRRWWSQPLVATALFVALALIAGLLYLRMPTGVSSGEERSSEIKSLAVMPFAGSGESADAEYLSDGTTESVTQNLALLPGLKVMSRSAMTRYRGQTADPKKIGQELDVEAILTGRVVSRSGRITVTAELVDTRDGHRIWGNSYEAPESEFFSIPEQIARRIAEQLKVELTGASSERLARRQTGNTEAWRLYLQGRLHWNKRTGEGLRRSIEFYNQALELDPQYALAYAGLADTYALLGPYGVLPPAESAPRARAAALKALELDPDLAEAHTSLAMVTYRYYWDWPKAESEFRRAIELNPNYATAHQWYGEFLTVQGRFAEGSVATRKAEELDPLSVIISSDIATNLLLSRRYDEAIRQYRNTLTVAPDFPLVHALLGLALIESGQPDDALKHLGRATELDDFADFVAFHAYGLGKAGRREEARKRLEQLRALSQSREISPVAFAVCHLALGEKPAALAELRKGVDQRADWLVYTRVEPIFDSLREEAEFMRMQREIFGER
jgi:serine/threonine protein kinase/tetratricopeptide (TPR) repeat protein